MKDVNNFIVKNALDYMERYYEQRLTLSIVAERIYVSKWHLSRTLNQCMQKNFSTILNTIRVEHAKVFLEEPSLCISDVAERTGFKDVAHFSKVFKKITGISPKQYRNSYFFENRT